MAIALEKNFINIISIHGVCVCVCVPSVLVLLLNFIRRMAGLQLLSMAFTLMKGRKNHCKTRIKPFSVLHVFAINACQKTVG